MSHAIRYDSESHVLEVRLHGSHTLDSAKALLIETADAIRQHECHSILADVREVTLDMSTLELHEAPRLIHEALSARGISAFALRRTVVVAERTPDIEFLQNSVVNRGHKMKVFVDIDEARQWLVEQEHSSLL